MDACPRYLCTCVYVIVCMSARKKAPVNLLMCPFELYMFIGVPMQLRVVFKYDFLVLIPYCWSVALEKRKKKKKAQTAKSYLLATSIDPNTNISACYLAKQMHYQHTVLK